MTPEQSEENRAKFIDEARRYLRRDQSGIVAVLKAHLFAEQMLNEVLKCNLSLGDNQLEEIKLTFPQKVRIVVASEGLGAPVKQSLLKLNSVRNKCAHRFQFEVVSEHWESIFEPFVSDMPYSKPVPESEEQKWMRWSFWLLGLLFPTADTYRNES